MKSFIRSIVSSPKQLHYDSELGVQLDLSYITSRIIVCSGPVNSSIKSIYRYPVDSLVKFLNANHGTNWHIWNFRGEEQGYDNADVLDKMTYLPFPDHQPPTLKIIEEAVRGIDQFLEENKNNVAILHCKAGKGRSGTLCCAYLMYKHHYDVTTSIKLYTSKRMRPFAGDGVSIKSQIRYLKYWGECLNNKDLYKFAIKNSTKVADYTLDTIKLEGPVDWLLSKTQVQKLSLQLFTYRTRKDIHPMKGNQLRQRGSVLLHLLLIHELGVEIQPIYKVEERDVTIGDNYILIKPFESLSIDPEDIQVIVKGLFYFWFNIKCESMKNSQPNEVTLTWDEIDGYKGTELKGPKLFESVTVAWH